MILVLILLIIFILLILITILFLISTIHIEIKNLRVSNIEPKIKSEYAITFSLYLGNHIKWLWFNLNSEKMKKYYSKIQLEKIDYKILKNNFKLEYLKELKKLKPKLSYLDLDFDLGVESPVTTAFLVSSIASIISIILPHVAKSIDKKRYKYKIVPIYKNKTLYKIKFNCIIEIKLVHIINIIYSVIKKGRSDNNERKTSNRKSYGYSYE